MLFYQPPLVWMRSHKRKSAGKLCCLVKLDYYLYANRNEGALRDCSGVFSSIKAMYILV